MKSPPILKMNYIMLFYIVYKLLFCEESTNTRSFKSPSKGLHHLNRLRWEIAIEHSPIIHTSRLGSS